MEESKRLIKGSVKGAKLYTFHGEVALSLKVADGSCDEKDLETVYLTNKQAVEIARLLLETSRTIEFNFNAAFRSDL